MIKTEKRYAITTSFYVTAKNDFEAVKKAKRHAQIQCKKNDDWCSVEKITHLDSGSFSPRKIDFEK